MTSRPALLAILVLGILLPIVAAHVPYHKPGGFQSPAIPPGTSWNLTLTSAGTYYYHCHPHPGMEATIVITSDAPDGRATIEMRNYTFTPLEIRARPGAVLEWINRDNVSHFVVESQPPDATPKTSPGGNPIIIAMALAGVGLLRRSHSSTNPPVR